MNEIKNLPNRVFAVTRWVGSPASLAVHTILFIGSFFAVWVNWLPFDRMLLILTTIVSLEAIYLAIFIQMTVNHASREIEDVGEDIDEIQKDIDEIQVDVDELQEDVEEIEESDDADEKRKQEQKSALSNIQEILKKLTDDLERLKQHKT